MEKKLKFSEFAELIGVTAKTVYKMEEREEITTVTEKVNNRQTRLVITNDEEIRHFRNVYSNTPVYNGNYEEIVTNNNESMTCNNSSQSTENSELVQKMFDKIVLLNEEYNNRIARLNEELTNSKSQLMFLEDKAAKEALYLNEIKDLRTENTELLTIQKQLNTENESLKKGVEMVQKDAQKEINEKEKVANKLVIVIVVLLMVIVSLITFNVATAQKKEQTQQEITQPVVETVTSNKPVKSARKK